MGGPGVKAPTTSHKSQLELEPRSGNCPAGGAVPLEAHLLVLDFETNIRDLVTDF